MSEALKISIERLYQVFSHYSFASTLEGCSCCVSSGDKEKLHTTPLRLLEENDISKYAAKAMTTWGNTDGFKYYLPRILELLATTDFVVDTFIVLGKLHYGKWINWATEEQEAIRAFLLAWWTDLVKNKNGFDQDAFIEIYRLTDDIDALLDRWTISFNDNSFKNLIDLVYNHYYDLTGYTKEFKGIDQDSIDKIMIWLIDKQKVMETGFFHYEETDPKLAEKASNALHLIEQKR